MDFNDAALATGQAHLAAIQGRVWPWTDPARVMQDALACSLRTLAGEAAGPITGDAFGISAAGAVAPGAAGAFANIFDRPHDSLMIAIFEPVREAQEQRQADMINDVIEAFVQPVVPPLEIMLPPRLLPEAIPDDDDVERETLDATIDALQRQHATEKAALWRRIRELERRLLFQAWGPTTELDPDVPGGDSLN